VRVFTFFLMMMVTAVGMAVGYRVITGRDLVNLAEFGLGGQASSSSVVAEAQVAPKAATLPPTPVPSPSPSPSPMPVPDVTKIMMVGNTGGQGVYLRQTPQMADKLQAWPDRTRMEVVGGPVDGEGQKWMKVRAPNGTEGYIPAEFLVAAP